MMLIIPVCVSDVILRFFPHLKKQRFDFVLKFPTFCRPFKIYNRKEYRSETWTR